MTGAEGRCFCCCCRGADVGATESSPEVAPSEVGVERPALFWGCLFWLSLVFEHGVIARLDLAHKLEKLGVFLSVPALIQRARKPGLIAQEQTDFSRKSLG